MEVKDIKRLLDAVAATEVSEFVYETGDFKLSVKRGLPVEPLVVPPQVVVNHGAAAPPPQEAAPPAAEPQPEPAQSHLMEVTAPIVGTFYASPAPGADPFVTVGDRVSAGTVLCIIEAMKLMNEIEAETAGTVVEVLVGNEDAVEYGQVLFRIDPG